ncbi:MAG: hypothetical protein J6Y06_06145 [Bacteroidales bacterium]|nr:hypothetical protein [Bacteroidales bacterium]
MRITNYALAAMVVLLTIGCNGNRPTGLKCEYQDGLVLIDTDSPRFSWINSCGQTAWQIKVTAKADKEVIWDSGKVISGDSHLVTYSGPALKPMQDYSWKVRVWDEKDNASGWSNPALIIKGPGSEGWEASWIGAPWQEDERGNWYTRYPMFRKEFKVGKGLESAKIFISGLGYFEARVN